MTLNKIKTERDQALASKKSAEDRLVWKETEFAELQTKHDTLMKQLNSPDSSLGYRGFFPYTEERSNFFSSFFYSSRFIYFPDTTAEGCRKEAQQLRNRTNYLENQLKDSEAKREGLFYLLIRKTNCFMQAVFLVILVFSYAKNNLLKVCHIILAAEKKLSIRDQEIEELTKLSGKVEATLVEQDKVRGFLLISFFFY